MTSGQKDYLLAHTEATGQELTANSLAAGVHNAFILAAAITVVGLFAGFFVRRSIIPGHHQAASLLNGKEAKPSLT